MSVSSPEHYGEASHSERMIVKAKVLGESIRKVGYPLKQRIVTEN